MEVSVKCYLPPLDPGPGSHMGVPPGKGGDAVACLVLEFMSPVLSIQLFPFSFLVFTLTPPLPLSLPSIF